MHHTYKYAFKYIHTHAIRTKGLLNAYVYVLYTGRVAQWSKRSALVPKVLGSNLAFSTKHVTCLFMLVE